MHGSIWSRVLSVDDSAEARDSRIADVHADDSAGMVVVLSRECQSKRCSARMTWRFVQSDSAPAPEPVECDGGDDDDADDDVLARVGNIGVDAAVVQDRHDQAADQGAQHGPFAAAQAAAADHHRGDDLQLEPAPVVGSPVAAEIDELKHAGQAGRQAADRVDDTLITGTLIPQSRAVASFEPIA